MCQMCGAPGAACCAGAICQAGGVCVGAMGGMGGMCNRCGAAGEACCGAVNAANTCNAGLSCQGAAAARTCEACGGAGQVCCAPVAGGNLAGSCTGMGLECQRTVGDGGAANLCNPCGATGEQCCGAGPIATRTCNTGLMCMAADAGAAGGPTCR